MDGTPDTKMQLAGAITKARKLIGKDWPAKTYEVTATGCRLFARAVGYDDLVFYDEAVAQRIGLANIKAPPGYFGTPVYHPADDSAPIAYQLGIPYRRALNGGTEIELFGDILAGDILEGRQSIEEIRELESSAGIMIRVVTATDFFRLGELIGRLRSTSLLFP